MLNDLIIGVGASLLASLIVGFLGNKAISKKSSNILRLYVLFLSIIVFVCCSIVCIALNKSFGDRIRNISDSGLTHLYDLFIYTFMFIIGAIVLVTLLAVNLEASGKGEKRLPEQISDSNGQHAK